MHTIRLRGPWQCVQSGDTLKVALPLTVADIPHDTTVAFELRRSFNRPTGLLESTTVTLVIHGLGSARILLNDVAILENHQELATGRFDITQHLRTHNQLRFEFAEKLNSGMVLHDAWLEISDEPIPEFEDEII